MLNKVWFWLLVVGILYGFAKGSYEEFQAWRGNSTTTEPASAKPATADDVSQPSPASGLAASGQRITDASIDSAKLAVELCIGLIGIMALWLGLLQVASDAGLVDSVARGLSPLLRWLFPEVPAGHPAQGAMVMNMAANMLGLENAATPMGLKAMQELQKLNPVPDTATNSMTMFLAINTSNVTLIPIAIIGYRSLYGSENPTATLLGTVLVTGLATVAAVIAARTLSKLPRYQLTASHLSPLSESPHDPQDSSSHE